MKIKITLQNQSPLSIRSDRADDVINTCHYVPGHSFRGALAALYLAIEGNSSQDDLFQKYFIDETICYSPLYPSIIKLKPSKDQRITKIIEQEKKITESNTITKPFPKTAISCKRWPGFKGMGINQEQHGVRDQLFEWCIYNLTGRKDVALLHNSSKCKFPECKEDMVSLDGFYKTDEKWEMRSTRKVKTQISMHTGIMHSTGTVRPGILYSIESIQEDYIFTGIIDIKDENEEFIQKFKAFLKGAEIRIGNKKTSGRGLCIINNVSNDEKGDLVKNEKAVIEKFEERVHNFNTKFKEMAPETLKKDAYFSIDLLSEAILLNPNLNYEIGFKNLLSHLIPEATLIYENVSPFKVMGWNNVLMLPKQNEWATEKGSVAFYQVPELSNEILKKLHNLEQNRIGIRKAEGFGILRISDPFHWEVRTNER